MYALSLRKSVAVAMVFAGAMLAPAANAASYTMDFDTLHAGDAANLDPTAIAHGVSFSSAMLAADRDASGAEMLDAFGNFIPGMTHWEAIPGANLMVDSPLAYGHGAAPSGTMALNALWDQVMVRFATPTMVQGISFKLDTSSYGSFMAAPVLLLDSDGKVLLEGPSFIGQGSNGDYSFNFGPLKVSSIVIGSSDKFYDSVTVTPVPEPQTYAMVMAGLVLVQAAARRRKN